MKISRLSLLMTIAIIGLTAFSCMNKQQVSSTYDINTRAIETSGASADFVANDLFNIDPNPREVNVVYTVRGNYRRTITKEQVAKAARLEDIIESYPTNWIESYTSVEVSTTNKGKKTTTNSSDPILTDEQKNLFKEVELASVIDIIVKYQFTNSVSGELLDREMNVSFTVIPETEASYLGGREKMETELRANSSEEMMTYLKTKSMAIEFDPEKSMDQFNVARILFVVNAEGAVENVRVASTSGQAAIDQELVSLIKNTTNWQAAENGMGEKVSQEFEFIVGTGGGC